MGFSRSGKPQGLLRWVLNFPRWIYRLRLGWLMGDRFLMFSHTGRRSGKRYQTVVEVVHHDRATGRYYIASGWGEGADWLKNTRKNPAVRVTVGSRSFDAQAHRMPPQEAGDIFWSYARAHPAAFRALSRSMTGTALEPTRESCETFGQTIPLVELVPRA